VAFNNLDDLLNQFATLGATQVLCKPLAENDNSKQQVYLGGGFEALQLLPHSEVTADPDSTTFKANINLSWIDSNGQVAPAPGSKLILYPRYPEVRLSGFLRGCPIAPSESMRQIPAGQRLYNNGPDGRLLFFGVRPDNTVLSYLALPTSALAAEVRTHLAAGTFAKAGVFLLIPIGASDAKTDLLDHLGRFHRAGWHQSMRLNNAGLRIPYKAQNGGGYTLEALFGIIPNGRSMPDFRGWEIKAYGSSRITLMTPEPDGGYYAAEGVESFVRRYGHVVSDDSMYFTGAHRANVVCDATEQRLILNGFDPANGKIINVSGGIELHDPDGSVSARWSFQQLIEHWSRKHAFAAYVPYSVKKNGEISYRYDSPVILGEGTDFSMYLSAMHQGLIVFDPGSKLTGLRGGRTHVKARSQFRVNVGALDSLYRTVSRVDL